MKSAVFHGVLVLDKPGGMTSRDVVDRAQRWFPRGTRLGHTGTLDPLATGVLALCVGAATRLTEYVQRMDKVYRAGIRFGARSDTDDADGVITAAIVDQLPDRETVARGLAAFVGEIQQVPPAYSAAKVTGRRAYDLARKGEEVTLQARPVQIYTIALLAYDYPLAEIEVRCGKGTYIRSLVRDLGERLGCGALVASLRRLRVGPFTAEAALTLDVDRDTARAHLLPMTAAVAQLPRVTLPEESIGRLRQGQAVPLTEEGVRPEMLEEEMELAVYDQAGSLVAVTAVDLLQRVLRPVKVLPAI